MIKEILENEVAAGKVTRKEHIGLKGGTGEVIVYTDTKSDTGTYESGTILMERGSSIGAHMHSEDSESYTVLEGMIACGDGIIYHKGDTHYCEKGKEHFCINLAEGESVIEFAKRK